MKNHIIALTLAAVAVPFATPALAQAKGPEVVQKGPHGRAEKVRVNGKVYDVCHGNHKDDCINPRAAGLHWGNRPLDHYRDKKEQHPAHSH